MAREAESVERCRAMAAEAEAQRARILAPVDAELATARAELRRLARDRNEVRDGLARLRESLQRTISELPGGLLG